MQLSSLSQIVHDEWRQSATLRREIRLYDYEFVIMPNYLHGIVWIVDPVGADWDLPPIHNVGADGICHCDVLIHRLPILLGSSSLCLKICDSLLKNLSILVNFTSILPPR